MTLPRRIPFPALALALCLLFAAIGAAVVDDYGISNDEMVQRESAIDNADYIAGNRDILPDYVNRFYSMVFELPLLMAERILRLQDSRDIFIVRHSLSHLLFIAGGFFCGLLAYRMLGNRWAAMAAMLLFLLHPRLYAHSFFNSKDLPFLVMFLIALYLTHRAFRRDTIGAFLLCGVSVGLAADLRVFGLMLFPAILAMRALDWQQMPNGNDKKRVLFSAAIFAASFLTTMYIVHPYYWENPLRLLDGIQTFSQLPEIVENLFLGQVFLSDTIPPHYIPTWFVITAPPMALLLGGIGVIAAFRQAFRAPGQILYNGELRFRIMLLACLMLPIIAVIILQSNIHNGWRQMYFLWAPFCLLAAMGLHHLSLPTPLGNDGAARALRRVRAILFPVKSSPSLKSYDSTRFAKLKLAIVYGVTAAGLGGMVYSIVSLHPHQQVYFNPLVAWSASENLSEQFDLDYWGTSYLQGLEYLRESYPDATLRVRDDSHTARNLGMLPTAERQYIELSDESTADFYIGIDRVLRVRNIPSEPTVYTRQTYGSAFLTVVAPRLVWGGGLRPDADNYRAAYQTVTATNNPAAQSNFDVYIYDNALYYVKNDCARADNESRFYLHFIPADVNDLPAYRQKHRFDNRSFSFSWRGGYFDGKCITQAPLPPYPIANIRTGQYIPGQGQIWNAEFPASP